MKKHYGVSKPYDTSLAPGGAIFPPPDGSPASRGRAKTKRHDSIQHRTGMYGQGTRRGWYRKGGRMPSAYLCRRYVVTDWHAASLLPPPCGYHWIRSDNGDFLLVSANTGIIASILSH
ncbi:MAG: RcnB family protein [Xanthomonadales bacterium]|nr:RcnB family protein [Xanthomonadales bacterium]